MNNNDSILPTLRIELDGIRSSVKHIFLQHNEELSNMVMDELDRQLQLEWVQIEIKGAVESCIKEAIDGVANNYRLKSAITDLIGEAIEKLIKEPK